ncbi:universal stress protein PHOS34-like [Andrographis paniculata]|uniref:universal stress protein PHOS34-like n=1 Tax=Andrographis paniculata TaxID=175694 RepID=UPI0021E77623|nr:universal stress protein PHOS34-like [Andrographis paniculata]
MGRIATKMPNFCLNRIRPLIRVRSSSSPSQSRHCQNSIANNAGDGDGDGDDREKDGGEKSGGRRIMIVVDSSVEAKNAVQWALSHTVQNHDVVILLHVLKPSASKQGDKDLKIPEFLTCIKTSCKIKRPEVEVEELVVAGKDKGPAIVEAAKAKEAALLVVGQKKMSLAWRLMLMWAGGGGGGRAAVAGGVAEYCVQNATCMAIAVRRKSKKVGGYLITTKRQKDFWLLA